MFLSEHEVELVVGLLDLVAFVEAEKGTSQHVSEILAQILTF